MSGAAPARTAAASVAGPGWARLRPEPAWGRPLRMAGLTALGAAPLLVFAVLFLYPVGTLVGHGLFPDGHPDASALREVFERARFRRILLFTVLQAAASALLCLLVGVPMAFLLYRRRFPGRRLLRALLTAPFVLPTVVVGLAFRTVFAAGGPLASWGWDGTVQAILAAHLCLNLAVVIRTVGAAWAGVDPRPAAAARSLGAGPVRVFRTVTAPALAPALAAATALVFLFCATSFGVIQILGGTRYSTVETEIYRQTQDLLDLPVASVLSLVQLLLVVAVLAVTAAIRRAGRAAPPPAPARPAPLGGRDAPLLLIAALATVAVLAPLVVLAVRSLRLDGSWTWSNYRALGRLGENQTLTVDVWQALANSLRTALLAAAISLVLGLALAVVLARRPRSRLGRGLLTGVDAVVLLPLGVSAVTVGFGFLVALDHPPVDLRGSALLVPLAQALVATPLVVRVLLGALAGVDDRLRQAAAVLGSGPVAVWARVDLVVLRPALVSAATFAFAVALGEFGATSFLARPQTPTLPVTIGRLISRPGGQNTGTALAAATVLALLCVAVIALVDVDLDLGSGRAPAVRRARAEAPC